MAADNSTLAHQSATNISCVSQSYEALTDKLLHIKAVADLMINADPDNKAQAVGDLIFTLASEGCEMADKLLHAKSKKASLGGAS